MPDRETLKRHAGLLDQMAQRVGVDLEEAALRGDLRLDQIADAVLRCTRCANPDHCQMLLAQAKSDTDTPEYCRNKRLFGKLGAGGGE